MTKDGKMAAARLAYIDHELAEIKGQKAQLDGREAQLLAQRAQVYRDLADGEVEVGVIERRKIQRRPRARLQPVTEADREGAKEAISEMDRARARAALRDSDRRRRMGV